MSCTTSLYEFAEQPASSTAAYLWSILILLLILVSTISMLVATLPEYDNDSSQQDFFVVESVCIAIFTLELLIRLFGWEFSVNYLKEPMNLIDLAAILPYYIDLAIKLSAGDTPGNKESGSDTDLTRVLRLFRLVRVFRVFKLSRHSTSMRLAVKAVMYSSDTLILMCIILMFIVTTFGGIVYVVEKGEWDDTLKKYMRTDDQTGDKSESPYVSMPEGMWWCLVTVMTVGYGDIYPVTDVGKVTATLAIVSSVMILALPISVIGLNFSILWNEERRQSKVKTNPFMIHRTSQTLEQQLIWYVEESRLKTSQLELVIAGVNKHLEAFHKAPSDLRERQVLFMKLKLEQLKMENLLEKNLRLVPVSDTESPAFTQSAYYILILLMQRARTNFTWMQNTLKVVENLHFDMEQMQRILKVEDVSLTADVGLQQLSRAQIAVLAKEIMGIADRFVHDGELSVDELTPVLSQTGRPELLSFSAWLMSAQNFCNYDEDHNGTISVPELEKAIQDYISRAGAAEATDRDPTKTNSINKDKSAQASTHRAPSTLPTPTLEPKQDRQDGEISVEEQL